VGDALTICAVFFLGVLVGSGIVGGFVGWLWASDERVATFIAGVLNSSRDLESKVGEKLLSLKRNIPL
jgi:hypothetical protein